MAESGPWRPWRELRQRDHILFGLGDLPDWTGGAIWWRDRQGTVIVIDRRAGRRERAALLTHELVHDERGGIIDSCAAPDGWDVLVAREELRVNRISASRLVPEDELGPFVDRMVELGELVTARLVADEFDTTVQMAELAMALLASSRRAN